MPATGSSQKVVSVESREGLAERAAEGLMIVSAATHAERLLVSVVVPCYNYAAYLPDCLDSVLQQDDVDLEVIVVDDASTDTSTEVAAGYAARDSRVSVVSHERNMGHIATYNDGIQRVTGEYVVLLSADDLLTPGSLRRATVLMQRYPNVGLVYGHPLVFTGEALPTPRVTATGWRVWQGRRWIDLRCRRVRNCIYSPEVVMRTAVQRQIGLYRSDLPYTGDLQMWLRAATASDVGRVEGADQAYYRYHAGNMHFAAHGSGHVDGMLLDLRQRHRTFDSVLAPRACPVPDAQGLLLKARRSLAIEALNLVSRAYTWGLTEEWPIDDLLDYALEVYPECRRLGAWRAMRRRWRLGTRLSSRNPAFVLREYALDTTYRLQQWRWMRSGV